MVFQEHTAPSSPGAAPATRGFRRASEISIASQVSGMAESYTASSIAQSECLACPPSTPPSVLQGGSVPPLPGGSSQKCLDMAGEGHYWHLVGRDQGCCPSAGSAQDAPTVETGPASGVYRGLWREGVLEGVAQWRQVHHLTKLGVHRPGASPGWGRGAP